MITVRHAEEPDLAEVRHRLEADPDLLDNGPYAVLYAVMDKIVDDYGPVIEGLQRGPGTAVFLNRGPDVLRLVETAGIECPIEVDTASYFVSTIELRRGAAPSMASGANRLFLATSAITADAAEYFNLPRDSTVIVGSDVEVWAVSRGSATAVFAPRRPLAALSDDSSTPGTRAALRLARSHLDHEAHRP